jgi:putative addiction module antidote
VAKVKLTTIGNSAGIILSRDVLAELGLERGDTLFITKNSEGIQLSPYDPEFEAEMESARRVMRRNRDALRRLAK